MIDEGYGPGLVLDTVPCGLLSMLDDGTITATNLTLREMLGLEDVSLAGRNIETILNIGSRIFYQTHLFPLLRLHGRADEIFLLLRTADGTEVGTLINAVRRERNGRWITDCAILRVHERRKFEDALLRAKNEAEEANRAKSTFLTNMSHELRTPLNAIGGYAQLLEMGVHGPVTDAQMEALDRITRSQRHLLRLINEVLNLARIESGQVHYDLEDFAIGEVVGIVLPMTEVQFATRGIQCEIEIPPDLWVHADREKVQQILLNLLSNASKFTPSSGHVEIDAFAHPEHEDRVYLRVRDSGSGIARNRQEQVFEPFVQVDSSLTRRAEGTGLGLAISRDLARGMGGDLRARGEEHTGSSFTLDLPRGKRP